MAIKRSAVILLGLPLSFLALRAPAFQQDPLFTSTTRMVEVTAIVNDSNGRPVTGLKKEDFTILENGKPQSIAQFVTEESLRLEKQPMRLPSNVYTNKAEATPYGQRSVNVLVLDYLNSSWASQAATREQIIKFMRTLKGDDVVAIYTMGQTLRLLHDFTSDYGSLLHQLEKSPGLLTPLTKSPNEIVNLDSERWARSFGETRFDSERFYTSTMQRTRTLLTVQTLSLIARHMAGFPGRKNLIWLSTGFPITILSTEHTTPTVVMSSTAGNRIMNMPKPSEVVGTSGEATLFLDSMNKSLDTINAAGVAVYAVDVSGLIVPIDEASLGFGYKVTNSELGATPINFSSQTALITFAERTGGRSRVGGNDIEGILNQALSDSRDYYLLTYHTTNPKMDGKFRKIEIRVNRPGVKVQHRPGYTAYEPEKGETPQLKGDLDEAGQSPVSQSAILLTAQARPGENGVLNVTLQIDASRISFRQDKDSWLGVLDLVFYLKSPDGKTTGTKANMPLKLTAEQYSTVMRKGILYRHSVLVPSGAAILRIGVRDSGSGLVGTLDIPLNKS